MKTVSIVMPAYNSAEFIHEAIESILNQDYGNIEVNIVDDGSTDATRDALNTYIESKKIRYFYQDNAGPGAARNRGIKESRGEYICFLDADDELEPTSISKRVNFLENNPSVALVFTEFQKVFSKDKKTLHFKENDFLKKFSSAIINQSGNHYIFSNKYFECALEHSPFILTSTVMMKSESAEKVGFLNTDLTVAEDVDYWLRFCRKFDIGFIDEPLTKYNNFRSVLTKDDKKFFEDTITFYKNLYAEVSQNKLYNKLLRNKLSILEFNYGYSLFKKGEFKQAKVHFKNSFSWNRKNSNSFKWVVLSPFLRIIHQIKGYNNAS